ncbi:efflux RND transporter periplasmic adaptor subunit [Pseudooceanicola sp. CBS1P-1]|uniref:Efflux RND transporter periplasmic adaptor subunit n=1 Tax=Pseudooceanicola albus TaxID=2692189 RepID=A0A6L7GBX6_9RHOB|nr:MULTISPECIES: efflux RND transporter periplasmic adaptor subunit [Pseudooceanicola]MBT9386243.1 efflux RND transporter periplasmic adaptor subunit [Pseudooceanicola endophyticus]MXN20293.1 efflux RND transporter periplasmic adaptor subunit [Pseudooceanicola albus]
MTQASDIPTGSRSATSLEARLRSLAIDRDAPQGAPVRRSGWLWAGLVLCCGGAAVLALPELRQTLSAGPAAPAETPAVAAPALALPVQAPPAATVPAIVGSGRVVAPRSVIVQPAVGGTVLSVAVQPGARVRQGQVLLRLDDASAQLSLRLAQAAARQARAEEALARAKLSAAQGPLTRYEALAARGAGTQADLEDARAEVAEMQRALEVAQREADSADLEVDQARDTLARYTVRAPFDAIVTALPAAPGMVLPAGSSGGALDDGLMTLVDARHRFVDVDVAERSIAGISPGMTAHLSLDALPERSIAARVTAIAPIASPEKGTVTVRVEPVGDAGTDMPLLRPGMTARVSFDAAPTASDLESSAPDTTWSN